METTNKLQSRNLIFRLQFKPEQYTAISSLLYMKSCELRKVYEGMQKLKNSPVKAPDSDLVHLMTEWMAS